ncbi:MAG: UDP-N-acetylmuramoyl-L-alanine--D-glutamate ligase [Marinifilaceae bacterium]
MYKNILVIGGGESGVGAAVLASKKAYNVFVSDKGKIQDKYKERLDKYFISWEEGGHSLDKFENVDLVIKSPGVPFNIPLIKSFVDKGVEVIDEIEFASFYSDAKMICITGSNGKTTTSMLIYHILKKAGLNVGLAGNIGFSLAYQVATENYDVYVIELSSFQLDGMKRFRANLAAIMNITPDHLDRYEYSLEKYALSKFRITQNMNKDDFFLYCKDDALSNKYIKEIDIKADMKSFAIYSCEDFIVEYKNKKIKMPVEELSLKGKHNQYNCKVATLAAFFLDVDESVVCNALKDFSPVEHRLEPVAIINGIQFINDSKATNVDSTWYALDSITNKLIWIVGGKDKGNDYSVLNDFVRTKVKAIVCLGVDNKKLIESFSSIVPIIIETDSAEKAVNKAYRLAEAGDVVLLSPCCASFDLFKSYKDRGEQFKQAVNKLI